MSAKKPIDAVLAVTYRCNARCVMCNIWREKPVITDEIAPSEYEKLPVSLKYINISGGEPFLRDDLPQIVQAVRKRCPHAQIIISTNGFLPNRIYDMMQEIYRIDSDIGIGFSLDGINGMHNYIRGVDKGYLKVMDSLEKIKRLDIKNIRFGFTVSSDNVSDFSKVYDLAQIKGIEFSSAVAQNSGHYFKVENNSSPAPDSLKKEVEYILYNEINSFSLKKWARAYFVQGLYDFACGNGRRLQCKAGSDFFFIDPYGNVYPCNVLDNIVGNVHETPFDELWNNDKAHQIRQTVSACQSKCWMICTARTAIRQHPIKVGWWMLNKKIKAHMRGEASRSI